MSVRARTWAIQWHCRARSQVEGPSATVHAAQVPGAAGQNRHIGAAAAAPQASRATHSTGQQHSYRQHITGCCTASGAARWTAERWHWPATGFSTQATAGSCAQAEAVGVWRVCFDVTVEWPQAGGAGHAGCEYAGACQCEQAWVAGQAHCMSSRTGERQAVRPASTGAVALCNNKCDRAGLLLL